MSTVWRCRKARGLWLVDLVGHPELFLFAAVCRWAVVSTVWLCSVVGCAAALSPYGIVCSVHHPVDGHV